MANVMFKKMSAAKFATITKDAATFYRVVTGTDTATGKQIEDFYLGDIKLNDAAEIAAAINSLDGSATIATVSNGVVTIKGALVEEDGVVDNDSTSDDIVLAKVATTGAAEDISVADSGGNFDLGSGVEKNIENVLAKIADMIGDANDDAVVKMVKATGNEVVNSDNVAEYTFYQGLANPATASAADKAAALIGTIEVAKDMVATSGTLVVATQENPVPAGVNGADVTSGTFIEMTIANGTPFYINVADLIEYNSFANKEPNNAQGIVEEIYVTDNNHTITLTVGKVAGTKIIYQAAVPASGTEGEPGYVPAVSEETVSAAITRVSNAADAAQADADALEVIVGQGSAYGTKEVGGEQVQKTIKEYVDDAVASGLTWIEVADD